MTIQIDTLELANFRCFRAATLNLNPELTVIVADNGMGKTAVLDALASLLGELVSSLTGSPSGPGILPSDVRVIDEPETRSEVLVRATIAGGGTTWSLSRKSAKSPMRRSTTRLKSMREAAATLARSAGNDAALPLIVYYPSVRLSRTSYFQDVPKHTTAGFRGRLSGYGNYLAPLADPGRFNKWFMKRWDEVQNAPAAGHRANRDSLAVLSAVRQAIATVLEPTGWTGASWDFERNCVTVEHQDGRCLPLSWLSSGIRSTVALVADLAHRCARLNPHLGGDAAMSTAGVVLIDEVDLHLHPAWQQLIVELLRSAFPGIQFVLTTHSPQVLSTVHAHSVRIVKHDANQSYIVTPEYQTRGVESADVLTQIMGVDPIPQVSEARDLQRFRAMIEDGTNTSDAGAELRQRLLAHFGEGHPLMLDCARLERFVAFKHRLTQEGGGDAQA